MPTLIVCRAEQSTNIPDWLKNLGSAAKVELSLYGKAEPDCHFFKGGKWAGIFDLFARKPSLLNDYDYFWFPDDDILTSSDLAIGFLEVCRQHSFELAQPALTPDSYFAYRETIQCPQFKFRATNLVELMMPCMRRDFLQRVLPLFQSRHAALGIDWMWQRYADNPLERVAIVDAYAMLHSRPRNVHLAAKMREQSISIANERAATFAAYDIKPMKPVVYGGQLASGKPIHSNLRITLELLLGYLKTQPRITNGIWTLKNTYKLTKKQLLHTRGS